VAGPSMKAEKVINEAKEVFPESIVQIVNRVN